MISLPGLMKPIHAKSIVRPPAAAESRLHNRNGNKAAQWALLKISRLIISVADGNHSFRDWRDRARAAQGVRPPGGWPWSDAGAVESAVQAHPQARAPAGRACGPSRPRAHHLMPHRRQA